MMNNIGLYIHIPFCKSKCFYCDFVSSPKYLKLKDVYLEKLLFEIKNYKSIIKEDIFYNVSSIFIGGGTPSILETNEIIEFVDVIKKTFNISNFDDIEFTIEANPESITKDKISTYRQLGINRVSIGLQSANDEELKSLGRIHNYNMFLKSYDIVSKYFKNINIDLMYNFFPQTSNSFKNTLNEIKKLSPTHLSIYSLIVEENTDFYNDKHNHYSIEAEEKLFNVLNEFINTSNYKRYEISNYAKTGYECKHNINYWENGDYIGFGVNASSHFKYKRFKNSSDICSYIENPIKKIDERKESKMLDIEDSIIAGFRMVKGIDKTKFKNKYNTSLNDIYGQLINKYISLGLIAENESNLYLTEKGLDLSNKIIFDFLN